MVIADDYSGDASEVVGSNVVMVYADYIGHIGGNGNISTFFYRRGRSEIMYAVSPNLWAASHIIIITYLISHYTYIIH